MDPELIDDCVHCGFCLPACPTYLLWGEEMDSPRGRINLMEQHVGGVPITPEMAGHFDACLGCMACVPVCPSGVRYDLLIEQTRAEVERSYRRPPWERALRTLVFHLFPYPRRLRLLRGPLRLYQHPGLRRRIRPLLPAPVAAMSELVPPIRPRIRLPRVVRARGERRAVVGMLTGCVQDAFFAEVNSATARVLAMEGCDVIIPGAQGCCGALSEHSGRAEEAARFSDRLGEVFTRAGVDAVVVNAAGCGSSLKEGSPLRERAAPLAFHDLTEFLMELGPRAERHPLPLSVAYHDACHLAHAQGITAQPRTLLRQIPGLTLREIPSGQTCCGSAGTYNLFQPDAARELGDLKAANVRSTGVDLLVSGNPGCSLQIASALSRAGVRLPVAHTAQVLDASLRGLSRKALRA
ncbi:(Fe-S)-binding protein [Rhizohabitans arisaemae]|uniref:(Fe-S)-binding protein n=1 Tax=Rhizohabitans arisaemae TaxID=2720610 RepID=UPI0024B196B1|nr:(Fe-S)-binding protein [Rhizohabitans arisaemae]